MTNYYRAVFYKYVEHNEAFWAHYLDENETIDYTNIIVRMNLELSEHEIQKRIDNS